MSALSLHDKHFIVFLGWKQKLCVQNGNHMQYKNMHFCFYSNIKKCVGPYKKNVQLLYRTLHMTKIYIYIYIHCIYTHICNSHCGTCWKRCEGILHTKCRNIPRIRSNCCTLNNVCTEHTCTHTHTHAQHINTSPLKPELTDATHKNTQVYVRGVSGWYRTPFAPSSWCIFVFYYLFCTEWDSSAPRREDL